MAEPHKDRSGTFIYGLNSIRLFASKVWQMVAMEIKIWKNGNQWKFEESGRF